MGKAREKIYLGGFGLLGAVVVSGWSFVGYQRENRLDCAVLPFFSFKHRQKPSAMFELAHTHTHARMHTARKGGYETKHARSCETCAARFLQFRTPRHGSHPKAPRA